METQCTPGPWELDPPETAHVTSEDYHNIRAGCGFLSRAKDQREPGFSISGHMTVADARLIAAAPDLLAALVGLRNSFAEYVGPNCAAADAAIAKATGSAA